MTEIFDQVDTRQVSESGEIQPRDLAETHKSITKISRLPPLTSSIPAYRALLEQAYRHFLGASEEELATSYAAEWLLDNYYIALQALRQVEQDLPASYYRQLPKLACGELAGWPRVYAMATEMVRQQNAHLDLEWIVSFVSAYQSITQLTMGELWSLALMLRLVVVQALDQALSRITGIPLPGISAQNAPLIDLSSLNNDDGVVANCFLSLRMLAAVDWPDFFESLSLVHWTLSRDPAAVYLNMDFDTRDRYRKVVEELSLNSGVSEQDIASQAVHMAQLSKDQFKTDPQPVVQDPTQPAPVEVTSPSLDGRGTILPDLEVTWEGLQAPRQAHIGYYLLDRGRRQLEEWVGYRLNLPKRFYRWVLDNATPVYLVSIAGLALLFLVAITRYAYERDATPVLLAVVLLLSAIPAVTIAVTLVNWVVTLMVKPRVLTKLDFQYGLPDVCRTLIAIPALLSSSDEVKSLLSQIEQHYLRNLDDNLYCALLTDPTDAPQENMPGDEALIKQAEDGMRALNEKYKREGDLPFLLLHRRRRWNPKEQTWMGWERKRGKLHELNQLILGKQIPFDIYAGDPHILSTVCYVITLDADTILPRDTARQLVGTLAHPLNRAEFEPGTAKVTAGYTILQPRTEINPVSMHRSRFTQIFSGETGLDLYTLAVSDVYQDLFGEGIYVGKGIYDVAAFERSLEGVVPENALLSHDLFEGIHGRAALVTDITLIEDYPPNYLVHIERMHRWVRGDWQLLPWLFQSVPSLDGKRIPNRLSWIGRWKILDNLRRSLVTPGLLILLVAGWLWLPGSSWAWVGLAGLALGLPYLTEIITSLGRNISRGSLRSVVKQVRESVLRWLLALVFLPIEAQTNLKAIYTSLVRVYITRRRLLHWVTAAQAARRVGKSLSPLVFWREMVFSPTLGVAVLVLTGLLRPQALPSAALLLAAWIFAPGVLHWLSLPAVRERAEPSKDQVRRLRLLARRTWLFFEQFIGPEDQWLPPDHFQESPLGVVAHRTSPTNIGMLLLSTLGAYDLGYIGLLDLSARLQLTTETLGKLEQYRGHFLNWYDTRSLEPLSPRYVSTVDSGNLAASLLVLGQAGLMLPSAPVLRWESWQGLLDTLDLQIDLMEALQPSDNKLPVSDFLTYLLEVQKAILDARESPESWIPLAKSLSTEIVEELEMRLTGLLEASSGALDTTSLRQMRIFFQRIRAGLNSLLREIELLLPWLTSLPDAPRSIAGPEAPEPLAASWRAFQASLPLAPSLNEIPEIAKDARLRLDELQANISSSAMDERQAKVARDWCMQFKKCLDSAENAAHDLKTGFEELFRNSEQIVAGMDFQFLFDPQRQLFHIGYNLALERLDNNYYDLLESEARIASLVAIGKGEIPQSHWLHLARPLASVDGTRLMLSWSATMFEYLMPDLVMRAYPGTLLAHSSQAAIHTQIAYGEEKHVPWGVSESGYYRFDASNAYQYRAFGVPGLGFKRGLGEDLVVAPYGSLLALPAHPKAVAENLDRLIQLGLLGTYGLYEAVDFTPKRLPLGQRYAIVQEYMSHHQGMIMVALVNFFTGNLMVDRLHRDPRIHSVDLLLQEQIPDQVNVETLGSEELRPIRPARPRVTAIPWRVPEYTSQPRVHILSNGSYGVLVTNSGAGFSTWKGLDLTRWQPDTTLDDWGSWIYVQELLNQAEGGANPMGPLWSAGFRPTLVGDQQNEVHFNAHMVEFRRRDHDISLRTELTIAPEDDIEVRRVTITNHSDSARTLRLTSYAEVALALHANDMRHPAFNKLFIESEYDAVLNALLFRRRPRSEDEQPIYLAHMLVLEPGIEPTGAYESDRERFLGRGQTIQSPQALTGQGWLTGTTGATLDPILSLGQEIHLEAHTSVQLAFLTMAASSRNEVLQLADDYRNWRAIHLVFTQAEAQAEALLRQLSMTSQELERVELLLSLILYPSSALRPSAEVLAANEKGQPGLWAYGISGDFPILLALVHNQDELGLVYELVQAHAYWRNHQVKIDLVIINEQGTDYGQELNAQIWRLLTASGGDGWFNRRGGIFLLVGDQLPDIDRTLLQAAARVVVDGSNGGLERQLQDVGRLVSRLPPFSPSPHAPLQEDATPPLPRPDGLLFDNGLGGFSQDGHEYQIYLPPGQWTPAPWINVIANPDFGFLVTETGSSHTWSLNSGENRLTPWSNDPVSDPSGEAIYLRDEETGAIWSPTPLPARADEPYLVRHGAGYSVFEHHSRGLKQTVTMFAPVDEPVKIVRLRLENTWNRARRITATYFVEWVLGVNREQSQQYVLVDFDSDTQTLLARNPYNVEFHERVAFLAANKSLHGLTADRTEFLGRMGSPRHPAALDRIGLASVVQPGLDPAGVLQLHLDLAPGESEEVFFLLGQAEARDQALNIVLKYREPGQVQAAWEKVGQFWDKMLGAVQVETPEPAMDMLLNRWLLYQDLACRVWGRSAFYQSSGAYGYRDQLQDVMALTSAAPEIAREHLLRAARHQFDTGDVLHWWHPPSGRGVRTRFSDDMLWLPFVAAHYATTTGDFDVFSEKVPFQSGPGLEPGQTERYGQYQSTNETYSLYEHCLRAIHKADTSGPHGLPLIGTGDWNDGMNRIGEEGRGESVWLGWFLLDTLQRFAAICDQRGDAGQAEKIRARIETLRTAMEANAWDGNWYLRAYYDDGSLLGSARNRECRIDAIAQSWAVLSGMAEPERARRAMQSVSEMLVRVQDRLILLFAPPFDKTPRDPGYIKGYLPGIRENGGQYTHAALWSIWAFTKLGQGDYAESLFRLVNPIFNSDSPEKAAHYRVEPYVVAADVYSVQPHTGRGGWTWYTGSAGWMYRLGLEAILGLQQVQGKLSIDPCIPRGWKQFKIRYRHGSSQYTIQVENPDGVETGVVAIEVDGEPAPEKSVTLLDDGRDHHIQVRMG